MRGAIRRPRRYHSIGIRARIRPSWNKYNLYNLVRHSYDGDFARERRTFFQQKWAAKALGRGYHGDHIREKDWRRMFSRRLLSTVDMPARYLALHDGAEQGAGRGSGVDTAPGPDGEEVEGSRVSAQGYSVIESRRLRNLKRDGERPIRDMRILHPAQLRRRNQPGMLILEKPVRSMTPYMQMTWAPLERRLDMALFRALFASSPRQARQFCIHGKVKVNGQKMVHPGYLLNPGDMFQVDVERVLTAVGATKSAEQARNERAERKFLRSEAARLRREREARKEKSQEGSGGGELRALLRSAKNILASQEGPRRSLELRDFSARLKDVAGSSEPASEKKLTVGDLSTMLGALKIDPAKASSEEVPPAEEKPESLADMLRSDLSEPEAVDAEGAAAPSIASGRSPLDTTPNELLPQERAALAQLLLETDHAAAKNATQAPAKVLAKPYALPWQPRPFMAPFAFIPRYLEVNQNVCAAVYLRHPVARPGLAEVPSPFPYELNQLAFNWYLRRR